MLGKYRNTHHNILHAYIVDGVTFPYNFEYDLDTSPEKNSITGQMKLRLRKGDVVLTLPIIHYDVVPVFGEYAGRELRAHSDSSNSYYANYQKPLYHDSHLLPVCLD